MEQTPTTILTYAPSPPFYRRRRFRRVLLLILGIALAWMAYQWALPAWRHGEMLYAQRQCLTYTAPADQVVYEEDPINPSPLLGQPGYQSMPAVRPASILLTSTQLPFPARPPVAAFMAPCLQAYAPQGLTPSGATLFLHERRTPSGRRVLVIVQRLPTRDFFFENAFALRPTVVNPQGWASFVFGYGRPAAMPPPGRDFIWSGGASEPSTTGLRFYAGQPNPADPAHFTIAYDLDGGQGIIDGRLSDDGNEVLLHVRTGPASGDSPWSRQVMSPDPDQSSATAPIP